jgi:hypothetical protein
MLASSSLLLSSFLLPFYCTLQLCLQVSAQKLFLKVSEKIFFKNFFFRPALIIVHKKYSRNFFLQKCVDNSASWRMILFFNL